MFAGMIVCGALQPDRFDAALGTRGAPDIAARARNRPRDAEVG